uniref:Putative fkbp-type peptidyl-prolyl cis-trans isomerase n=1 Tax=Amblyomma triste TaxID=251400 RepID=A0A023G4G0_AMBTT
MAATDTDARAMGELSADGQTSQPALSEKRQSTVQNFEHAKVCKQEGNDLYYNHQIKPAIRKYHECLLYVRACQSKYDTAVNPSPVPVSPEVKEELERLKADCYNNLAACLLLRPNCDYSRVVTYCDNVLRVLPGNVKALYRKGVAHYHMGNYTTARSYLNDAKRQRKTPDEEIAKYIKLCNEATERPPGTQ